MSFQKAFAHIKEEAQKIQITPPEFGSPVLIKMRDLSLKNDFILFGCGIVGKYNARWLRSLNARIAGVCDSNKTGVFAETGQEIMSPQMLREKYPDAIILIASGKYIPEIKEMLKQLGFSDSQIYICDVTSQFMKRPLNLDEFMDKHYSGFEWAYSQLTDDSSREALLASIRSNLLYLPMTINTSSPEYYERGIIELKDGEVFIDVGAHVGETVLQFIMEAKQANIHNWKAYAFEADAKKYEDIERNVSEYIESVEIVPKGLWSEDTELDFVYRTSEVTSGTFLINDMERNAFRDLTLGGGDTLKLTSLDAYFKHIPQKDWPTFIKMNIEGSEIEALKGSKEVLRVKQSKLAISVYHLVDHPYECMRIAKECVPGYRFYYRNYLAGYSKTVLYAV